MASIARDGLDFDKIYPIGSIYISANSINPHNLFGGVWEQIKGRFLLVLAKQKIIQPIIGEV